MTHQSLFDEGAKIAKGMANLLAKGSSALSSGKKIISPTELAQQRLDICEKCPSLDKDLGRCRECGCFVQAKVKMNFEDCPVGKW